MPHRSGVILLGCALALAAQEPDPIAFFRPSANSIVKAGVLSIVAKAPAGSKLLLDGKPLDAKAAGSSGLHASVNPAAGLHELTLTADGKERKISFFVESAAAPAPASFLPFRQHPPAAACETCHTVKDGAWIIQGETTATNCVRCHDEKTFAKVHQHNTEVLNECQMCHCPHGSTAKKHLKLAKETACKQCHG